MRHKKTFFCIISLLLLMSSLLSITVSAAEVPKDKYTLTFQRVGTVKEKVNLPDYEIIDQEIEMILVLIGSDITFAPSVNLFAAASGLEKEDGIFYETYDTVPWLIDGERSLVTEIEGGKTAAGTLGYYTYYMFDISDDNGNLTRTFFKTVDSEETVGTGSVAEDKADTPDEWANAEVQKAISLKLVPEQLQNHYKDSITRGDFCNLVINMIEIKSEKSIELLISDKGIKKSDNPFTDATDEFIINANALGIVNGKGNGKFDPNGSITRQEAAVMLTNAAKVLNQQVVMGPDVVYEDASAIAEWAKPSVSFVASMGVMNGTGNNNFSPQGTYSRQQAFMTIMRLFESVK